MSQEDAILFALKLGQTLTPIDALKRFGCFRLGARIYDLKKAGHKIDMVLIRQGDKHYTRYSMGPPKP